MEFNRRRPKMYYSFSDGGVVDMTIGVASPNYEESDGGPIDLQEMIRRQMAAESSLIPGQKSHAGAVGLAQFTPIAQKEVVRLGIMGEGWNPDDPTQARDAMTGYMEYLYDRPWVNAENSDPMVAWAKALYAYNAGTGTAVKSLNELKEKGYDIYNSLDWINEINDESRGYIEKVNFMDTEAGRKFQSDWPTYEKRWTQIYGE